MIQTFNPLKFTYQARKIVDGSTILAANRNPLSTNAFEYLGNIHTLRGQGGNFREGNERVALLFPFPCTMKFKIMSFLCAISNTR
jgi:hypothetical protein